MKYFIYVLNLYGLVLCRIREHEKGKHYVIQYFSKPLVKPSKLVVHVDDQTAGPSHLCDDTLTDVNNNSTPKV